MKLIYKFTVLYVSTRQIVHDKRLFMSYNSCQLIIIIFIIFFQCKFFTPLLTSWFSLESEWQQVFLVLQTFLRILVDLDVKILIFSIPSLISISSNSFSNPLGTVPRVPTTKDITVNLMFHSIFSSLARSRYLYTFSFSFIFTHWSSWTPKYTNDIFFCFG